MSIKAKVFLLESPDALDLLEERGERTSLEQVCKLFGHDATSFLLRDSVDLNRTLLYIGSIGRIDDAGNSPLFIHISVHGNSEGIVVGSDDVSWNDFTDMISQTYDNLDNYAGAIILILSACGANRQKFTNFIQNMYEERQIVNPPDYVFVFSETEISWRSAVVTWTMFYHDANELDFLTTKKGEVIRIRKLLDRIAHTGFGTLIYFRWDGNTYKMYKAS